MGTMKRSNGSETSLTNYGLVPTILDTRVIGGGLTALQLQTGNGIEENRTTFGEMKIAHLPTRSMMESGMILIAAGGSTSLPVRKSIIGSDLNSHTMLVMLVPA